MAAKTEATTTDDGIRALLDNRGFLLLTDDERRRRKRAWIGRVDQNAVCALAAQYCGRDRDGKAGCRVVDTRNGSFNVCFFVACGDGDDETKPSTQGARLVVRIPIAIAQDEDPWPKLQSEVATMRYLQQHTKIPIPHIYAFGRDARLLRTDTTTNIAADPTDPRTSCESSKPCHINTPETLSAVPFLITDSVKGQPLNIRKLRFVAKEVRQTFLAQLVDILADLRALEFPRVGSLLPDGAAISSVPVLGPVQFKPFASVGFPRPLPPFSSARDYLRYYFRLVATSYREPDRDQSVDDLRRELFALHHLEAMLDQVAKDDDGGPFVLHHADLHNRNILVDDAWQIQGVIDWEFATTMPQCMFVPPSWVTGHDGGVGKLGRRKERETHTEFQAVLAHKARTNRVCATLQDEWYGEAAEANPGPDRDPRPGPVPEPTATDRAFSIANCLHHPSDISSGFYEFLAPKSMRLLDGEDEENECFELRLRAELCDFFKRHNDLAAEAQRRADVSARYTAYLKENGLYETDADRAMARFLDRKNKLDMKLRNDKVK